jgi:hypothetical protein
MHPTLCNPAMGSFQMRNGFLKLLKLTGIKVPIRKILKLVSVLRVYTNVSYPQHLFRKTVPLKGKISSTLGFFSSINP